MFSSNLIFEYILSEL